MPQIILFTTDFLPQSGGVAAYYAGLQSQGIFFKVITNVAGAENLPNTEKRVLFWPIWPHWLPMVWQIFKVGRQYPRVIMAAGQILPVGTAMYLWHLLTRRPYGVFLHGFDVGLILSGSKFKKWLAKRIMITADWLVVNSLYTESLVKKLSNKINKTVLVYPCPDLNNFDKSGDDYLSKYKLQGKKVILTVGRLVKRKGLENTLADLATWLKQDKNLIYVIVGDGPLKQTLKDKAQSAGLSVILTGQISEQEKWAWYKKAEIFVMRPLPDKIDVEGFGIVYLEAQAAGCLVVGNWQGGVPEAVGQAGLLFDEQTNWVQACQAILSDKTELEGLNFLSQQRLAKIFNWPTQAKILKNFLDNKYLW